MIEVIFACDCCQGKLVSPARCRGKTGTCPLCGRQIGVPVNGGNVVVPVERNQSATVPDGKLPKYPSPPPVDPPESRWIRMAFVDPVIAFWVGIAVGVNALFLLALLKLAAVF